MGNKFHVKVLFFVSSSNRVVGMFPCLTSATHTATIGRALLEGATPQTLETTTSPSRACQIHNRMSPTMHIPMVSKRVLEANLPARSVSSVRAVTTKSFLQPRNSTVTWKLTTKSFYTTIQGTLQEVCSIFQYFEVDIFEKCTRDF